MTSYSVRWYQCPKCKEQTRSEIAVKDYPRYIVCICAHCGERVYAIKQVA